MPTPRSDTPVMEVPGAPAEDLITIEAATAEEALERVSATLGTDARIVSANKVRRGGVGGFFAREMVQVRACRNPQVVQVPAGPVASPPPAAPPIDVEARMDEAKARKEQLKSGTMGASFETMLERYVTNDHGEPVLSQQARAQLEAEAPTAEEILASEGATAAEADVSELLWNPVPDQARSATEQWMHNILSEGRAANPEAAAEDWVRAALSKFPDANPDAGRVAPENPAARQAPPAPPAPVAMPSAPPARLSAPPAPPARAAMPPAPPALVSAPPAPPAAAMAEVATPPPVPVVSQPDGTPIAAEALVLDTTVPGTGAPAWSPDELIRLQLPFEIISKLSSLDSADDGAWVEAIAESVAPYCGPLPAGDALLVGPRASLVAEGLGIGAVANAASTPRLGPICINADANQLAHGLPPKVLGERSVHVVASGPDWEPLVELGAEALSWTSAHCIGTVLRLCGQHGLTLGYYRTPGGRVVRATPFDVALQIREQVTRR